MMKGYDNIREAAPGRGKRSGAATVPDGRKKKKSVFRRVNAWLHLWLGLASGIIVLIVSLTGAVYVFEPQGYDAFHREQLFVQPLTGPALPLDSLWKNAQRSLGESYPITNATTYNRPDRAWSFLAVKYNPAASTYFGYFEYYYTVYVNPYTGRTTGIVNNEYEFFSLVKFLHWSLLLSTELGQPIVGWGTLVFAGLLLTGLVLWWPKKWTKTQRDKSFRIRWKARWKRLNYDLHNVLGFYCLLLALVITITGLAYSFPWVNKTIVYLATGRTLVEQPAPAVSTPAIAPAAGASSLEKALAAAWKRFPEAGSIITPGMPKEKDGAIIMRARMTRHAYYKYNILSFDRYSGVLIKQDLYTDKTAGEKFAGMNYDIHVGTIGGLPTQLLAFFASLVCASLPVTGFYVWWNKRKKKVRRKISRPGVARSHPVSP